MRAIVYREYGSPEVLRVEDVEKPVPGADEVLIRVRAAATNPMDYHVMGGTYLMRLGTGLLKPKPTRPGADLAGEVEAVGSDVTRFRPLRHLLTLLVSSPFVSQKVVFFIALIGSDDLVALKDLVEAGKVTPVIDRCYALGEAPEAIRYLKEGHARGKVVLTVQS